MWAHLSDLIVAANVGIILFFTVVVAPTVFMVLPAEWSAAYVRKFFPKYFFSLGLTTALAAGLSSTFNQQIYLVACAMVFFFSCFWLTPKINEARDGKRSRAFKYLHWSSVVLNLLQLILFLWILAMNLQ